MNADKFHLGRSLDGGSSVDLDPRLLTKHAVVLGASGSGKTCLSKILVEDAVRFGIPVIAIDSQGDLASLGLAGTSDDVPAGIAAEYWNKVDLKVWTPGSEIGLPVSLQPSLDLGVYDRREDRVRALHAMGQELAALTGWNDEGVVAGYSKIIDYADRHELAIDTIDDVCEFLKDPPVLLQQELENVFPAKDRQRALKALRVKMAGPLQLLMELGQPIDIMTLFGYEEGGAFDQGKTRISVISLMAIQDMEERQIFVAALARKVYAFMLQNPKSYPMGMVFLDEAAAFLPPVRKPPCKDPLMLLLRQGRKYGISMLIATQSPGDLDYVGMGQIGTKLLGKMSTQQEAWKVRPLLENDKVDNDLFDILPDMKPGEFIVVCPDAFAVPTLFKSRRLVTQHQTVTLDGVGRFVSDDDRVTFYGGSAY